MDSSPMKGRGNSTTRSNSNGGPSASGGKRSFKSHDLSDEVQFDVSIDRVIDQNSFFPSNIEPTPLSNALAAPPPADGAISSSSAAHSFYGQHPPPPDYYGAYPNHYQPYPHYPPPYPWPYPPSHMAGMAAPYPYPPPPPYSYYPPPPYHQNMIASSDMKELKIGSSAHSSDGSEEEQSSNEDADSNKETPVPYQMPGLAPQSNMIFRPHPPYVSLHPHQMLSQQPSDTFESTATFSDTDRRDKKNSRSRSRAARLKDQIEAIKAKSPEERTQEEKKQFDTYEERRLRKNQKLREKANEQKRKLEEVTSKVKKELTHEEQIFMDEMLEKKIRKSDADRSRRARMHSSGGGDSVSSSTRSLSASRTSRHYIGRTHSEGFMSAPAPYHFYPRPHEGDTPMVAAQQHHQVPPLRERAFSSAAAFACPRTDHAAPQVAAARSAPHHHFTGGQNARSDPPISMHCSSPDRTEHHETTEMSLSSSISPSIFDRPLPYRSI